MQTVLGFAVLDQVDMPVVATTGAVLEQGDNARCCDDRCMDVQFLDPGLTWPLLCNARCTVSVVKVVDIPVVTQAILMVSTVPQLQFIDKVIDVSVVQVQQVLGSSLWRQSRSHSCSSLIVDTVVHMPVVVQRQVPNRSDVQETVKVPQLQYI